MNRLSACFLASFMTHLALVGVLSVSAEPISSVDDTNLPGMFSSPGIRMRLAGGSPLAGDGDCPRSYVGVGIDYNPEDGQIFVVQRTGPAGAAGVHPGDVIIVRKVNETSESLLVRRGKQTLLFRDLALAKICVSNPRERS